MTNLDRLRGMEAEKFSEYLFCPYCAEGKTQICKKSSSSCKACTTEWLNLEVDEPKEEQKKKPPLPKNLDMFNFNGQLDSLSLKAIVQNLSAVASRQNRILDYLRFMREEEDE